MNEMLGVKVKDEAGVKEEKTIYIIYTTYINKYIYIYIRASIKEFQLQWGVLVGTSASELGNCNF